MTTKEDCCICFTKLEQVRTSCCRQPYCIDCFVKAVGTNPSCPTCRAKVETEKKDTPGTALELPKELLEPKNREDLQTFLHKRLIEHASQMWTHKPFASWQEFIKETKKGTTIKGEVAHNKMTVITDFDRNFLSAFDAYKIHYFAEYQKHLAEMKAINPVMVLTRLALEDGPGPDKIKLEITIYMEFDRAQVEVYYNKGQSD
jgi:hypothetical protein